MKFEIVLCALVVFCGLVRGYDGDGQPGCKTQTELDVALFRNNWDATSYWKCEAINQPASEMKCPSDTGFLDSVKNCVNWEEWKWEAPVAPLSEADQ